MTFWKAQWLRSSDVKRSFVWAEGAQEAEKGRARTKSEAITSVLNGRCLIPDRTNIEQFPSRFAEL
jgi:hypothetical protein